MLVAELIADPEAVAILPEPLGRDSIAVLARELHGLEPDQAFCAALESATGGNPLFIGAVLDAVAREGISPTIQHVPRLLEIGAQGVSRAVGLRLARLPPEALALLRAGSILGDGTELRHAAALAGVEAHELGSAAATLVRLDLLRRQDPVEFFHPVVRAAVHETLDVVERDAAHRSAAYLLVHAGAPPESVAGHLLLVTPGADPFVVSTLRQAAERSLAQGAAEAAVRYLTRALEEEVDPAARAEVLVELGLAERRTNGPAAADHLRDGLELLADPARRGKVALELGRALWFTDRIADALAVLGKALDEIDRERDPDLYELLAELISSAWWDAHTYPIAEAAIHGLDLDALHGGLGSEILLATMAHYEHRLALHRERAVELARRALAPGNLLASGSVAFYYAANLLPRRGCSLKRFPSSTRLLAQARRRGDVFNVAFMLMVRGYCQTLRGDLRAALADLREAIDLCVAHGMPVAWPYNIGFLAHALLEQGETGHAARVIDEGGFPEQLPVDQLRLVWFRLYRGRLRIKTGNPERGVEELLQVGQTVRLIPCDNPSSVPWRSWAAEGLRVLGRNDEARVLAEEELVLARRWGDPQSIGASLRVLGLVEGGQAGIGRLREAVEVLAGSEARLEHARPRRPRRSAPPREPADRGTRAPPGGRRPRAPGRSIQARRAGERRDRRHRCETAKGPPDWARRPHRERAARGATRGRGDEQQRDRPSALRHHQDDRGAPERRLSQARDRLPRAARQRPPDSRIEPAGHFRLVPRCSTLGCETTLGPRLGSPPMRTRPLETQSRAMRTTVARAHRSEER